MIALMLIKVNGDQIDINQPITLEEAQDYVATGTKQGLIEPVPIWGFDKYSLSDPCLLAHEEGLLHDLPLNRVASNMARTPIVGDVLVVRWEASDFADDEEEE